MNIGKMLEVIRSITTRRKTQNHSSPKPRRRSELDIYFTQNFHERADAWGLTEDHARHVFYEGDTVKANMKVATVKGQEIGIYVFRDRDTNQPVITSIWKRPSRTNRTTPRR